MSHKRRDFKTNKFKAISWSGH